MQKSFSFAVRDSLVNVGPVKDFAYGLRINADANATGISKQSNYELVSRLFSSSYIIVAVEMFYIKYNILMVVIQNVFVPQLLVSTCLPSILCRN